MIVSLKESADPTAVLRALVSRGLWVSQVERAPSGGPRGITVVLAEGP